MKRNIKDFFISKITNIKIKNINTSLVTLFILHSNDKQPIGNILLLQNNSLIFSIQILFLHLYIFYYYNYYNYNNKKKFFKLKKFIYFS